MNQKSITAQSEECVPRFNHSSRFKLPSQAPSPDILVSSFNLSFCTDGFKAAKGLVNERSPRPTPLPRRVGRPGLTVAAPLLATGAGVLTAVGALASL